MFDNMDIDLNGFISEEEFLACFGCGPLRDAAARVQLQVRRQVCVCVCVCVCVLQRAYAYMTYYAYKPPDSKGIACTGVRDSNSCTCNALYVHTHRMHVCMLCVCMYMHGHTHTHTHTHTHIVQGMKDHMRHRARANVAEMAAADAYARGGGGRVDDATYRQKMLRKNGVRKFESDGKMHAAKERWRDYKT